MLADSPVYHSPGLEHRHRSSLDPTSCAENRLGLLGPCIHFELSTLALKQSHASENVVRAPCSSSLFWTVASRHRRSGKVVGVPHLRGPCMTWRGSEGLVYGEAACCQ